MIYTHLQAIEKILEKSTITNIIEFGSGDVSTKFFLDKNKCPDLTQLTSIETQSEWIENIKNLIGEDDRWDLILVKNNDEARQFISNIKPQIVLLDSVTAIDRVVQAGMFKDGDVPFIVLHDSDRVKIYKERIHPMYKYNHTLTITENNPVDKKGWLSIPSTTIFSNEIDIKKWFE